MDSFASCHFLVEYRGGPETLFFFILKHHNSIPQNEFRSTVTMASPVIKVLSLFRKKAI